MSEFSQPPSFDPPPPPSMPSETTAGFFGALFDFSFTHFVTPKIVKFVYVLATIVLGLVWLVFLVAGFSSSAGAGAFALFVGPIITVIYLAFIRMTLEFYLAVVRTSEDIHKRLPQA